ncbi:MAG: glycosyltransferase [Eubacterium sp.]
MKTAILIPCYNEAKTIERVIKDFQKHMPNADIYVYDNNSTDDTYNIAKNAGAIVRREVRQGKGNVVRSMFRDIEADCYIMADGDNTYPAEFGPILEREVLEGRADMAVGDRLSSTYFTENKRRFHNFGNVLVKDIINFIYHSKINDVMTGARAFSRDFVKSFPVLCKGFEIETEMTIFALDNNFRIVELPISYQDREEGSDSKLNTYSDGFKVLKTIFELFRDTKPMTFFTAIASIFMLVALVLFIPVLIEYFETGLVPRMPTFLAAVAFGITSLINMFTGVILSVLRKQHRQQFETNLNIIRSLKDK